MDDRQRPMLSLIPCATCGALPTGEYNAGKNGDDQRKYSCRHDVIDGAIASLERRDLEQQILAELDDELNRGFMEMF